MYIGVIYYNIISGFKKCHRIYLLIHYTFYKQFKYILQGSTLAVVWSV